MVLKACTSVEDSAPICVALRSTTTTRAVNQIVHAIGDGGVRRTLDAFEKAAKANPAPARGRRHRIEHIETMDPADVPRFKALSVIGSFQPPHARLMNNPEPRGQWAGNIGAGRTSHGWMWKSVKDAGGRLLFGSDWPVASLNPLVGNSRVGVNRIGHGACDAAPGHRRDD